MSKSIHYNIVYRGTVIVDDDATKDEIYIEVQDDHERRTGGCVFRASEVHWEEYH